MLINSCFGDLPPPDPLWSARPSPAQPRPLCLLMLSGPRQRGCSAVRREDALEGSFVFQRGNRWGKAGTWHRRIRVHRYMGTSRSQLHTVPSGVSERRQETCAGIWSMLCKQCTKTCKNWSAFMGHTSSCKDKCTHTVNYWTKTCQHYEFHFLVIQLVNWLKNNDLNQTLLSCSSFSNVRIFFTVVKIVNWSV